MKRIVLHSRTGPDGKLYLEVLVGRADTEYEVQIVARPKESASQYPPGYFELFGSIQDETFVRPPQGKWPSAMELE